MFTRFLVLYTACLLMAALCHAQAHAPEQQLSNKEISILIDSLGNALSRYYIYPAKATEMMSSIKKKYKSGAYNSIKNRADLGRQLNNDLQQAHKDGHLEVMYHPQMANDLETYVPDTASNRRAYEHDLHDALENNFGFKKVELLPGNIGYLRWDVFCGLTDEALPTTNGALRFVSNCSALIIDMRNNGGGSPDMVVQLQSYFFKEKTPMNYTITRSNDTLKRCADPAKTDFKLSMPVYILTSHSTFSAAEDFIYGLRNAGRITVVGDTTGGGAHPTRPFSIGHGFVAFIPTQYSYNMATHTDWEGIGIWPDAPVPAAQALTKAQALIYAQLLSKATGEREKNSLQWLLASTENKALVAKQIQDDNIKIPKEDLLKYCGEYNSADPDAPKNAIYIVLTGTHLARHVAVGAADVRLIPIAAGKFAYDDESGRTIEFVTNTKDNTSGMILSNQDGVFTLNKK